MFILYFLNFIHSPKHADVARVFLFPISDFQFPFSVFLDKRLAVSLCKCLALHLLRSFVRFLKQRAEFQKAELCKDEHKREVSAPAGI